MEAIFIILCIVALLHYVYESAIAPSLRYELRFQLFELRDRLRSIEKEEDNISEIEAIDFVESILCNTINHLPKLTLSYINDIRRVYKGNTDLEKEVEERKKIIDNSDPRIRDINRKALIIFTKGLLVNSGGWFYIIIPLLLILKILAFVFKSIRIQRTLWAVKSYKAAYVNNDANHVDHAYV